MKKTIKLSAAAAFIIIAAMTCAARADDIAGISEVPSIMRTGYIYICFFAGEKYYALESDIKSDAAVGYIFDSTGSFLEKKNLTQEDFEKLNPLDEAKKKLVVEPREGATIAEALKAGKILVFTRGKNSPVAFDMLSITKDNKIRVYAFDTAGTLQKTIPLDSAAEYFEPDSVGMTLYEDAKKTTGRDAFAACESALQNLREAEEISFAKNHIYTNDLDELSAYIIPECAGAGGPECGKKLKAKFDSACIADSFGVRVSGMSYFAEAVSSGGLACKISATDEYIYPENTNDCAGDSPDAAMNNESAKRNYLFNTCLNELLSLKTSMELYYVDNAKYPDDPELLAKYTFAGCEKENGNGCKGKVAAVFATKCKAGSLKMSANTENNGYELHVVPKAPLSCGICADSNGFAPASFEDCVKLGRENAVCP